MMRLQMIQKPPVVFTLYDPAKVISQTELDFKTLLAQGGNNHRIWFSYAGMCWAMPASGCPKRKLAMCSSASSRRTGPLASSKTAPST